MNEENITTVMTDNTEDSEVSTETAVSEEKTKSISDTDRLF